MEHPELQRQKARNLIQSMLLVVTMSLFCGYLAWLVGGPGLALFTLALVILGYQFNPALSPHLILRLYRGRPLTPREAPELYRVLEQLAHRAGLPATPTLYYIPSDVMNAFATGSEREAVIALSDGLLRRLDLRELTGVLGHEISHIRNRDLRVMGFADLVSRLTGSLSLVGQLLLFINLPLLMMGGYHIAWLPIMVLLFAPTVSALIQLALSRNREYDADLGAVELTGDPKGLAQALGKMERYQGRVLEQILWPGQRIPDPSLLRTHPPTEERIRRLMALLDHPERLGRPLPPLGVRGEGILASQLAADPFKPRWHRTGTWF